MQPSNFFRLALAGSAVVVASSAVPAGLTPAQVSQAADRDVIVILRDQLPSMPGQFLYLFWWGVVAGVVLLILTPFIKKMMPGVKYFPVPSMTVSPGRRRSATGPSRHVTAIGRNAWVRPGSR